MTISEAAFRFRPAVFLVAVALMVYGALSYFSLPAREDPKITIREATVTTAYPGLPAERVEMLITKPLEEAVLTVSGVEEIRSISSDGQSIIYAKAYDRLNELDQVWDELEEAVQEKAPALPEGTSPPRVNDNFGDVGIITLALTGEDYDLAELYDFAQHSRDSLTTVPGTRKVEIIGAVEERIFIEVSSARLAELGIPPDAIAVTLSAQNTIAPGGQLDAGERAFSLIPTGAFKTVDDIRRLLIRVPEDGSLIALGDIAEVTRGFADPAPRRAYFNGQPSVVLSIAMQPSQSVLHYSRRAEAVIEALTAALPVGLDLNVITWQADQVENAVYGVSANVLQTLAIVLGLVILFLGVRTGLIVGSIVPAVMLTTLAVMGVFEMSLERMSLATLVIALGLLVDNGVVVAEHFKRLLGEHGDRDQALAQTGRELAIPLLSSSLTTILVFLPLMLAEHASGEYTRNISLVILISLSASWVLAMTVTPTLCYLFLKAPEKATGAAPEQPEGLFGKIETAYGRLLRRILRYRLLFVSAMFALLPVGGFLVQSAPAKFFPDSDRAQILVYVNLPAGVTTRTTDARMKEMMDIISDKERYPDLGNFAAYVGFGGPRFVLSLAPLDPAPHVGFFVINATDREAASAAIPRLRDDFRRKLSDVEARVSGMFLGPSDPNVIQIQVKGPDADYIVEQSKAIERMLADIPGTIDIWSNWYNPVTRLAIDVDQPLAQRAGVSSTDVARSLSNFVSGQPVSAFRDGDEVFPIISRAMAHERNDVGRLKSIPVFPQGSAEPVPLEHIAQIAAQRGFGFIHREDLTRTVTVEARNLFISPEDMAPLLQPHIDSLNERLAPGHLVEFDGIVKDSKIGRAALFASFPLCIGLSILLLVAQFNDYRRPLIVVLTIPLVVIGVGIGLQLMQAQFGFLVILGLLALAGIIVNNAIVLIDRIDIERRMGDQPDFDAVISASARRLRPILMTTITTIVGLLPLIVGKDVLFYGMASIMAFGLAIGTVLTLGVTPALYCLFFKITPPENRANASKN
ncbi:efflux RND transporter permease subunit [Zobellella sp. DQSA1]|uniref:efflux RND transporter permease subunit n=1 Tax=Zobellella sp. DQSA1 TaxID=3342386 RepID=UPI0035BF71E4